MCRDLETDWVKDIQDQAEDSTSIAFYEGLFNELVGDQHLVNGEIRHAFDGASDLWCLGFEKLGPGWWHQANTSMVCRRLAFQFSKPGSVGKICVPRTSSVQTPSFLVMRDLYIHIPDKRRFSLESQKVDLEQRPEVHPRDAVFKHS